MLKAENLNLSILQLSIFTPNISSFAASKALAVVLSKYSQRYNGNVQALPLTEDIPPEIPRIVLQSEDRAYGLEISPMRVNSIWIGSGDKPTEIEKIVDECKEVLEHYLQSMGVEVNRLSLVATHIYQTDKSTDLLINKFCKPELINTIFLTSETFEIHNHFIRNIENFKVNVWTRCKSGFITKNNQNHSAIIVEQDLNTLLEDQDSLRFSLEEVKSFFENIFFESQTILNLYFPNSEI